MFDLIVGSFLTSFWTIVMSFWSEHFIAVQQGVLYWGKGNLRHGIMEDIGMYNKHYMYDTAAMLSWWSLNTEESNEWLIVAWR